MLLDTHALLWFLNNDARLPKTTSQKIEEAEFVFVSIVSIWEIAIKANIGKLVITQLRGNKASKGFKAVRMDSKADKPCR